MAPDATPRRQAGLAASGGDLLRAVILAMVVVVPYLLGAVMAYFVLVAAIGAAIASAALPAQRLRLERAGWLLLAAYAIFAGVTVLVAIVAQRPGELAFALNFIALPLFVPLFSLLARGAHPDNTRFVASLALAGAVLCLGFAIVEVGLFGARRAGASTVDPIRFGATAAILGFLPLIGVRQTAGPARWLYLLGPLVGIAAVFLSGSRSAFIAVPILATVAIFWLVPGRRRALAVLAGLAAATAALLLVADAMGLARLASLIEVGGQLLAGEPVAERSTRLRISLYTAALAAAAESPWIGYGWSQLTAAPAPYIDQRGILSGAPHLHNDPLDLLVAVGLPGLVCYALIIAAPVAGALAAPRDGQYGARVYGTLVLSATYLVTGQFSLMLGFEYQTVLFVGLAAIILGYCRDAPPGPRGSAAA